MAKIYTIGYSGKTKEQLLEVLDAVGIRLLIDVRLWRQSRFVPWASGANLAVALGERYHHVPEFAPTKELLSGYKDGAVDWAEYECVYNGLLKERQVQKLFSADKLDSICFFCAEKTSDKCHRRMAAEYMAQHFHGIEIIHV